MSKERSPDPELETESLPSMQELYRKHVRFVWSLLQRFGIDKNDLEDATQEVFLLLHQKRAEYKSGYPVRAWIYSLSLYLAQNWKRKAYRIREKPTADFDKNLLIEEKTPEEDLVQKQNKLFFLKILSRLSEEKRAVFVMHAFEELECEDIAKELECPLGTVHSRLYHARKELSAHLLQAHITLDVDLIKEKSPPVRKETP